MYFGIGVNLLIIMFNNIVGVLVWGALIFLKIHYHCVD
jgi:hypothetical protein